MVHSWFTFEWETITQEEVWEI